MTLAEIYSHFRTSSDNERLKFSEVTQSATAGGEQLFSGLSTALDYRLRRLSV